MGHVSANNSSANDKFFLAGHDDLPSVQPNCYGHRVSSFMSCNSHRERSHLFSTTSPRGSFAPRGVATHGGVRLDVGTRRHYAQNLSLFMRSSGISPSPIATCRIAAVSATVNSRNE